MTKSRTKHRPKSKRAPHSPLPTARRAKRRSTSRQRNGNIARLPKNLRDLINQSLLDGVPYRQIIKRIQDAGLPRQSGPTPGLPRQSEATAGISPQNISQWRKGGYKDWLIEQQWREDTRTRHEAATDLIDKLDLGKANQAALYVAALQIFEALRGVRANNPASVRPGRGKPKPRLRPASAPRARVQSPDSEGTPRSVLSEKLGGDCAAYARLVSALARASRETLALQKHSETRTEAKALLPTAPATGADGEPKVTGWTRGAILGALDVAMGFDKPVRFVTDHETTGLQDNGTTQEREKAGGPEDQGTKGLKDNETLPEKADTKNPEREKPAGKRKTQASKREAAEKEQRATAANQKVKRRKGKPDSRRKGRGGDGSSPEHSGIQAADSSPPTRDSGDEPSPPRSATCPTPAAATSSEHVSLANRSLLSPVNNPPACAVANPQTPATHDAPPSHALLDNSALRTPHSALDAICPGCGLLPPALAPDIPRPWGQCRCCWVADEAAAAAGLQITGPPTTGLPDN